MKSPLRNLSVMAKAKVAIGLAAAAAVAPAVTGAFAASGPAPASPTITSGPSGTVASTSAAFTYSHSQSVTFQCSLDGADFKKCATTGVNYGGLTNGTHTFRVAAQTSGSPLSTPASRTWVVDREAPAVTMAFPANGASYKSSAWNAGCTTPGICGTASDPNGVQVVWVSIQQASSGKWWNGSSFASTTQAFKQASGTTTWGYALPVQADGGYTVMIRATDGLGNMTATGNGPQAAYSLDNVAPGAPTFTKAPEDPTFDTSAQFQFNGAEAGLGFTCSLDGAAPSSCTSPVNLKDIDTTSHCFGVRAVDKAGNQSAPTTHCWVVALKKSFLISGSVAQPFFPGASRLVDLTIANPFPFDIKVTDVAITVDAVTKDGQPNPDCSASENLVTSRAFNGAVIVPKNSTKSLSQLSVPESQWPILEMPNLPYSQDACKSSLFHFDYTGTATKP